MSEIGSAGRGVPGAVVVKAGERFTGQNSRKPDELQFQPGGDAPAGHPSPSEFAAGPRFERLIERVHALGVRPLAEMLAEIAVATGRPDIVADRVEAYARLDPEIVRAIGGDKFPPMALELIR